MPQLNRGIILRFVREALGQFLNKLDEPRYSTLMSLTLARLADAELIDPIYDTSYKAFSRLGQNDPLAILLTEGYQQLIALGYIVPRPDHPNAPDPNWFAVTDIGRQWASGGDPVPEDQQGFLATLTKLVPNLDPVIRQYTQEALLTYERGALFASAVMIGPPAKGRYLLMDALHGALLTRKKKKICSESNRRTEIAHDVQPPLRRYQTGQDLRECFEKGGSKLKG
jgi:hypothetical protein